MSVEEKYKKKFWLVVSAILLLAWIAIRFGFSKTLELKHKIGEMSTKIETIKDAPERLQVINQRLNKLDQYIGDFSGEDISPLLMEHAGKFCETNHMVLKELPEKHVFISNNYSIVTYKLVVKGDFKSLLRFLHELETNSVAGRIHSANFEIVYNVNNNQRELFCTYYIQAVGKTTNEL